MIPLTETGGVTARLRLDTLDNPRFPRAGHEADVRVDASRQRLGAADADTQLSASFNAAASVGPHTAPVNLRRASSACSQPLPVYGLFSLGGFLELSGCKTGELVEREMSFGRLVDNCRVGAPGLLDAADAGVSMEGRLMGDAATGASRTATHCGGSLYFAVDSPLGPRYLADGRGDNKHQAVYLFLGRP